MSHFISLREAKILIGRYDSEKGQILKNEYAEVNVLPISEKFERAAFDTLLAKEGCAGLRFYFGMLADLRVTLIAVAIDEKGNDILAVRTGEIDQDTVLDDIVEKGQSCPPFCHPSELL
ncbi:MAG: hypothetical protein NVV59_01650 [Chitinophagaceae bacterium]|nr:hypothetical protein [Chitinophagaceae bacterium]